LSGPTTWHPVEMRELSATRFGPETADRAFSAAQALTRDCNFAVFHAKKSHEIINGLQFEPPDMEVPSSVALLRQIGREAEPGEFERPLAMARFEATAHIIACFRSLHAATDLLAPVIWHALDLQANADLAIPLRALYPATLRDALVARNLFPGISAALKALIDNSCYRFVRAFVNASKHQSLVPAGFTVSFDMAEKHTAGMRIGEFEYDGDRYGPKWMADFTKDELTPVVQRIIVVLDNLNTALAQIEQQPSGKLPKS
jgi:hypothetical protein